MICLNPLVKNFVYKTQLVELVGYVFTDTNTKNSFGSYPKLTLIIITEIYYLLIAYYVLRQDEITT